MDYWEGSPEGWIKELQMIQGRIKSGLWISKAVAAASINDFSANALNKGVNPIATVEGVSGELLQFDPEHKIWCNPSANLPRTATFSIIVRSTDWQKTLSGVARQVSQIGEYISYGGYTLTLTGVGAGVGVPLASVGNGLNFAGGIGEAYFTNNSAQGVRSLGFFAADQGTSLFLKRVPGLTTSSYEILRQNASLKWMLMEKGVNNYYSN